MDSAIQNAIKNKIMTVERASNEEAYICLVCKCRMAGSIPTTAHLTGSKHQKKLKLECGRSIFGIDATIAPMFSSSVITNDILPIIESNEAVEDAVGRNIYEKTAEAYKCRPCDKILNSLSQASQHLEGKSHLKAMRVFTGPSSSIFNGFPGRLSANFARSNPIISSNTINDEKRIKQTYPAIKNSVIVFEGGSVPSMKI